MNSKRVNLAFLLVIIIHILVIIGLNVYWFFSESNADLGIVSNLLISQSIVIFPVLFTVLVTKKGTSWRMLTGIRAVRPSVVLMTILFTFLVMPLANLLNAVSMLFVDNAMLSISADILEIPFPVMFFLMAVLGPFCEELVFRGFLYHGYRRGGNIFGAIVMSSLLFGLMHMNFNQAPYAFALGVMLALVGEAASSVVAPMICHMIFNAQSVCLLYIQKKIYGSEYVDLIVQTQLGKEELIAAIAVYLILAFVGVLLAGCVLVWIAGREGKLYFFQTILASRRRRVQKFITPSLVVAVFLVLLYMFAEVILLT